jgi:hypothetical protein
MSYLHTQLDFTSDILKSTDMKKAYLLLILSLSMAFHGNLKAQVDPEINQFIDKIDYYLDNLNDSASNVFIKTHLSGKIVKITGNFENETKAFKQRIKTHKFGNQKDKIVVKYIGPDMHYTLLKVILINGEYFYVKKLSYSTGRNARMTAKEELINGRAYLRTEFDSNYHKSNSQYYWQIKKD